MAQPTKTLAPCYISGLRFENLKCFSDTQTLSFLDRDGRPSMWNLLLGENGVGKTTVLQCLTWMRPVEGAEPYDFIQPALANEENSVYEKLVRIGTRELVVKAEFCKRNPYGQYKPMLETGFEAVLKRNGKLKDAYPLDPKRRGKKPPDIQIIAYSANRLAGHLNLSEDNIADPVSTIFETVTTLYDPEAILMNLDHAALKDKTETAKNRRDQVKNLVAAILPYVAKPKDIRIGGPAITGGSTERSGVHFKTPDDADLGAHGTEFGGIHHIGFYVDDIESQAERLKKAGGEQLTPTMTPGTGGLFGAGREYSNAEVKFRGPDCVILDMSESGWQTSK